MFRFYINPDTTQNPNGNNEVHREGCHKLPFGAILLGRYNKCSEAVEAAKEAGWTKADGCVHCCKSAHEE
ncbi:MAG: hypothetical protein KAQ68_04700 [Clostridiales bacterium]|nr:hypothetical protein [Clostridiales bacterium]